jgi:uncharacterized protein YybS (DUF2232 family)
MIDKIFLNHESLEYIAIKQIWHVISKYFVGMLVFSGMIITISNLLLAQLISKKLKMNIRPEFNLAKLTIPNWMAVFWLVSLAVADFVPSFWFVGSGLSVVGLFAPMLAGFAVINFLAEKKQMRGILIATYVMLFIIPLPIILIAVAIGTIDSFWPMRGEIV